MVSSVTPLWRNGPEDKPVLCNACGSRYKKRGSLGLEDYLPKNFQPQYFDKYKDLKGRKRFCFNLFMLQIQRFILVWNIFLCEGLFIVFLTVGHFC